MFFRKLRQFCQTTWCHRPVDSNVRNDLYESLKSRTENEMLWCGEKEWENTEGHSD
jgi:hypothetical protein